MFWRKKSNFKKNLQKDLPLIILGLFLTLIIRLLRPIISIRFARWGLGSRIGHLTSESDIYLAERKWNIRRNPLDKNKYLYYIPGQNTGSKPLIPNQYIFKQVKAHLPGLRYNRLISWADFFNAKLFDESSVKAFGPLGHIDQYIVTSRTPPPFRMSRKDSKKAQERMRLHGINESQPILLFFNRDSAYIKDYFKCDHDQINDFRNSKISNYIPMAEYFAQSGYTCIRMGLTTEEKLLEQPGRIIDLSGPAYDEFVEFYLFSISRFSVCDVTGLNVLPALFRKPRVLVNVVSLMTFYDSNYFQHMFNSLLIFKKHWCLDQKRILTASEIMAKGLAYATDSEDYRKKNVKLINNTAEEIQEAALEMHLKLNNQWEETEADLLLQHRFWKNLGVKRELQFESLYPKVGANFLRNNDWLLT